MDGKSGGTKVNQENGGMKTTDGTCSNPECPTCPVVRGASEFGSCFEANKVTIKDGTVFNAKGQAIGTVAPIDELIARYVEPSTPDQMLDANARAAATISASATRGAVAIEEREFFDPQSGNMVRVSGDLKATLVHARTGMPVGWCGHHPCALNPKVCLLEQENERQLNEYADRCQSLASESYLRLHEKVSIGRSIAMLQQSILDKQNTNRVIGVYLRDNHLTPEDGAAALALYQFGITGPELLEQAVRAAESRNRAGIKPDGGAA